MAGTGAAFSLLPPENATGNYVKVVQRVPVKIVIDPDSDPDHLLRVGMSVVPTVYTGRTLGDVLGGPSQPVRTKAHRPGAIGKGHRRQANPIVPHPLSLAHRP